MPVRISAIAIATITACVEVLKFPLIIVAMSRIFIIVTKKVIIGPTYP